MTAPGSRPLVYVVAGEESGDRLGASLMRGLRSLTGGEIAFAGVGGAAMTEEGIDSLFPMEDLAVMGLSEVLPRLPSLLARMSAVTDDVRARTPDVLVTIDAPDFNFRVAKRLKGAGVPIVHYVAPSVWAWRPERARKVAGFLDHLLTLLPFEPPYFEAHGLGCTYVGHPVLQGGADKGDGAAFRQARGIAADTPLVVMLPGSRGGECSRLLPIFTDTLARLGAAIPNCEVAVATVAKTRPLVEAVMASANRRWHLVDTDTEKYAAFAAADAALAASGTVALELAMAGTPAVIGYRMSPLTNYLAPKLVKTPYVNLVNIILGREAVPELLLTRCRAELMIGPLQALLTDPSARAAQQAAYREALEQMGYGKLDPSRRAAEAVLGVIADAQKKTAPQ